MDQLCFIGSCSISNSEHSKKGCPVENSTHYLNYKNGIYEIWPLL